MHIRGPLREYAMFRRTGASGRALYGSALDAMKPCVGFVWVRGGADVSDRVGEGDVGCEGPKVDTFELVARARRTVGCLGHRACFVRCVPWVPAIFGESRAPRGGRRGRRRPWHGYASTSLNFLKMLRPSSHRSLRSAADVSTGCCSESMNGQQR